MYIEHQYHESLQFLSNFRRMSKDGREHFYGIQYFDVKQMKITPKLICFELINTKDETSKYYFRVYESAVKAETGLNSENLYLYYDEKSNKIILDSEIGEFKYLVNQDNSLNSSTNRNNQSLSEIIRAEYLSDNLIKFVNIYLEEMLLENPDLVIEAKDWETFWEKIDQNSEKMTDLESLWP